MEVYHLVFVCCMLFTTVASYSVLDAIPGYANDSLADVEYKLSDCRCENGRCVTDNRGNTKCACRPGYALQEEFNCQPCDCGSLGKCIFILQLVRGSSQKSNENYKYQKKCVCDVGSAEKDGVCIDCYCGENSACDFDYGTKRCYCIEGYSEKDGVCTRCDCGFYGKCGFDRGVKKCECDRGYLVLNGQCEACDCGDHGVCSFVNGVKTCQCQAGYSVNNGRCDACDCGENSVQCRFNNGAKSCICKDRFADRYGVCEDCDCGQFSYACSFDDNVKTCHCVKDYVQKSSRCEVGCSARNPCQNGGYCKGGFCFCLRGTRGEFCEVIDECPNLCPRQDGIYCTYDFVQQKALCKCRDYNFRYNPDVKQCRNPCDDRRPCQNGGTCSSTGSDAFCRCLGGTTGDFCEKVTECDTKNCGADAICMYDRRQQKAICGCNNRDLSFDSSTLQCKKTCDEGVSCHNGGLCERRGDYFFCRCRPGTSGDLCEVVVDCVRGLCGNSDGVRCLYDVNREGGVCRCTNPEHLYVPESKTCKACDCGTNSVSCKYVKGDKVCACRDGFEAKNGICRKTRCVEKSCLNGKCVVTSNEEEVCSCYEGYELEGDYCRRLNCTKTPCENGTCIVRRGNIEQCICPDGHSLHSGVCLRGACSVHTCFGGFCRTFDGELMCVCPKGYSLQGVGCFATVCKHQECYGGYCYVREEDKAEICVCPKTHYLEKNVCKRRICRTPCYGGDCQLTNEGGEVCVCPSGLVLFKGVCRAP